MFRLLACLALLALPLRGDDAAAKEAWRKIKTELVKSAPHAARDGCPNVARKLRAGEAVTVAFLGGSITENTAGFSTQIPAWLRAQFPAAKITAINAGWAGTGSDLGAQRIDLEVLAHRPDLLFVEFAVNDIAAPGFAHMERIVRKTWDADAECDIVFLYTLSKGDLDFYKKGLMPLSPSRHERTAAHYGVPMISVAHTVAGAVNSGHLAWAGFSADTCHPHVRGYEHYTAAITAALAEFFSTGKTGPHPLPASLVKDFVLRPPRAVAEPQPPPATLRAEDGREALRVFEMPALGRQWIGEEEFKTGGRDVWRLYWQPMVFSEAGDAIAGLDRARWQRGIVWLDEARFFLGPSLRWIAGGTGAQAGGIGANRTEIAVVAFVVPEDGEYVIEFGADEITGYSQHEKQVALNLAHIPAGAVRGKSLAYFSSSRAAMKPVRRTVTARLNAGDEVAIVFLPLQAGGGAAFRGVRLRAGWLEK